MKIERLRNKKSKLIFLCGFLLVVVLLVTVIFKGSKAKYRNSNIIPLINTKIKNNVSDFTIMGIYLNDGGPVTGADGKKYTKQVNTYTMPSEGYIINETNSYCEKFNPSKNISEPDNNVKLYTDILGNHSLKGVSQGDKCYIYFDEGFFGYNNIGTKLLLSWGYMDLNTITERTDFDKVRTDGRNKVYKAKDNDGWSYYLVGQPENNWVKFGGHYWRIVRINGDGSLRMIYSGSNGTGPQTTGEGTHIGTSKFNELYSSREYAEYMNSSIKGVVDTFYTNNLASADIDKYIDKNAGFCIDEYVGGNLYASYNRILVDGVPILTCDNSDTRLLTVNGATKGNKKLVNPIGLITVDEIVFGGLTLNTGATTGSNMNAIGLDFWTITPGAFFSNGSLAGAWYVVQSKVGVGYVIAPEVVRPVINLVKNVNFSKGNGSISSPFEI